jgi:hypothetical protein
LETDRVKTCLEPSTISSIAGATDIGNSGLSSKPLFQNSSEGSTTACSMCDVILEGKFINFVYICETKQFFLIEVLYTGNTRYLLNYYGK